ncbi:hypothetical protein DSAG12_02688 [Promethearchaeum syntrophicum]|uniref:Uncharacterized protein n=1 Tax=Promethearchaeum syntrophicum TaxID=2594042 RepID=A0A5B9DCB6_9ARCH|nr:hypothetical protein [Candidatus Prometheoarchaeum syntrophicum]QEE16858.1 hypothetical protein DSAG12_02688 [Candidatus Prometheoarchaeum syntrophicum]
MKKDTFAYFVLIFIAIPFGIFLSIMPNNNSVLSMGQRIGHCFIFTGVFTLISLISSVIQKKKHPQSFNELIQVDQEFILFNSWKIIKDNNRILIKVNRWSYYYACVVFGAIGVAITYIILPRVINFEPSFMFPSSGLLIGLMILIDFCVIAIIAIFIIVLKFYNLIKIIDADEKIVKISNRERYLNIPISNLNHLNVKKNDMSGYFELLIPITGNSGDLSIIKNSLSNNQVILVRDQKKEEMLMEIMMSIRDFFEKFPI